MGLSRTFGPLLPAALLALIVGGAFAMPPLLKPNKAVEPPPAGWEKLGMHPAYTLREFDDIQALGEFCRAVGATHTGAAKRAGEPYTMACVDVDGKVVAVPTKKAWPSRKEIEAVKPHEFAHTWGLIHTGDASTDWVFRDGSPAFPLSDRQVEMMRAMAAKVASVPLKGGSTANIPLKGDR